MRALNLATRNPSLVVRKSRADLSSYAQAASTTDTAALLAEIQAAGAANLNRGAVGFVPPPPALAQGMRGFVPAPPPPVPEGMFAAAAPSTAGSRSDFNPILIRF